MNDLEADVITTIIAVLSLLFEGLVRVGMV